MPSLSIQPYLFFHGRCEEALAFYRTALGAEVELIMHFKDSPDPNPPEMVPPGWEEKVMHATVRIGDSIVFFSDGGAGSAEKFEGFSLSLNVPDEAAAERAFAALAEGGTVQMPLTKTFWSPYFGMVVDRFDMGWMVTVPAPPPA